MADMLATPTDLRKLPGLADLTDTSATALLEIATAVVQGTTTPQILVEVAGDAVTLLGTTDSWLELPQRPVTDVTSVQVDGLAVTDYKRFGARLWRESGWSTYIYEPSTVEVVYDHGYPLGDRGLELARSAALMVAGGAAGPSGVTSESIDDYQVVYEKMAARMEASPSMQRALRKVYVLRGGLVRVG